MESYPKALGARRRHILRPSKPRLQREPDRLEGDGALAPGDAEELANKSGFKFRGADVQLAPVVLPGRLLADCENAADLRLWNALGREN